MGFALRLSPLFRAFRAPSAIMATLNPQRFSNEQRGSAAVEFAIVGPILLLIMTGIFTYGGYFLTAHTVQQLANDAARAAIAGLDDEERLSLARTAVQAGLAGQPCMRGDISALEMTREGQMLTFRVGYDAREDLYWAFEALLPVPSPEITRRATIRMGGY